MVPSPSAHCWCSWAQVLLSGIILSPFLARLNELQILTPWLNLASVYDTGLSAKKNTILSSSVEYEIHVPIYVLSIRLSLT